ncbi:unnamed protein product [Linum trigynum]|uniref:Uncharacterized protein n=1 Tax=Linum trigynum TaxID=586398 RepID=A0AAV2EZL4_9ROSI
MQQKYFFQQFHLDVLCKSIFLSGLLLFLLYTLLFHNHANTTTILPLLTLPHKWSTSSGSGGDSRAYLPSDRADLSPMEISHVGFVVIGSLPTWRWRKHYIESWWRPNVTRGYVFLDKEPTPEFLPWPATSPPYRVSSNFTNLKVYPKLVNPPQVRMVRAILDMYRQGDRANEGLRWLMVCDDDTLVFVDNLVEVLSKFDHTKYHYIGGNSESVRSNADFSFDMGFGGAGYALSWPLVEALSSKLDGCIERYPRVFVSDHMVQSCLADLGVAVAHQKGIHQIDLHGDISGFLSTHPQAPLVTLHHFDAIDPIFPSMDRPQAIRHLMTAAEVDQSRLSQQTICYHRQSNWSVSVSWGYSAYIYENIIPRSTLIKPLETFKAWVRNTKYPAFMFNTRWLNGNACESPHVFYFQSVDDWKKNKNASEIVGDQVITTYARKWPANLQPCELAGNHSASRVDEIQVVSPGRTRKMAGVIECCDVDHKVGTNVVGVTIRSCLKDEVIA